MHFEVAPTGGSVGEKRADKNDTVSLIFTHESCLERAVPSFEQGPLITM